MARTPSTDSHHVRFARAIALVATLGGVSTLAGCYDQHGMGGDAALSDASTPDASTPDASTPDAAPIADAGHDAGNDAHVVLVDAGADAALTCETCVCLFDGEPPPGEVDCNDVGLWTCCAAIGPLAPPELAV
jgi:hypothetical protein